MPVSLPGDSRIEPYSFSKLLFYKLFSSVIFRYRGIFCQTCNPTAVYVLHGKVFGELDPIFLKQPRDQFKTIGNMKSKKQ